MKKTASMLAAAAMSLTCLLAQNPIVPEGVYNSDPQARVWRNGKELFVYGSRDEDPAYYCSRFYDVLSTGNMIDWKLRKDSFASVGKNDEVGYNDEMLYAPDCIEWKGKYYLFYSQGGSRDVEGVAVSASPYGPFKKGSAIKGANQIDPSVFIDDDGQAYLFFGQFAAKCAKLNPDMRSIDVSSLKDSIITEAEHNFHEGIQAFKRNGTYYLVFADISRRGMPTCLGYATSDFVTGPYTYRGVIVDNFGCDPFVWNNHGSVVEFGGQWYVFYHRATNGGVTMRKSCVEPIYFNPDGTIDEVPMTTSGAAGPLDPYKRMGAERACFLTGNARMVLCSKGDERLGNIRNQNTAAWKTFDFFRQPEKIKITLIPKEGGHITVYANNLCLPVLAFIDVPSGDGKTPLTVEAQINTPLLGVHPLFMRFSGAPDKDLFDIDSFIFE